MRRRLAALIGITTAVLAFGLTSVAATGHGPAHTGTHAVAEGKGPTDMEP